MGELSSVQECFAACKGKSSLFIYGRPGSDRCTDDKCVCQCQTDSENGECTKGREDDDKYDLYLIKEAGKDRLMAFFVAVSNQRGCF